MDKLVKQVMKHFDCCSLRANNYITMYKRMGKLEELKRMVGYNDTTVFVKIKAQQKGTKNPAV